MSRQRKLHECLVCGEKSYQPLVNYNDEGSDMIGIDMCATRHTFVSIAGTSIKELHERMRGRLL